ncbi:peptidase S8/S53 domain-containing protein [Helicostylum pulchrum]|nr:peptidase S8/S53 domain-containing protein [Helicostylum pulchrum]
MVPKTFIFFAVSCVSAVASANNLFSGLDTVLTQGNGNYIIQLNQTICIKHFVPRFIDNAFDIFTQSLGAGKVEKRSNNRIVRRDTDLDQVHVFDAYDIGGAFKGITVQFEDLHIVRSLLTAFNSEILKIIPDMDVEFDLPTNKKSELLKRYYLRQVKSRKSERVGNFDFDHYDHDENLTEPTTAAPPTPVNSASYAKQTGAEWNLVRVSQRSLDLEKPYIYEAEAASDIYVYVVDDGMNVAHKDFGGRAKWGFSAYKDISKLGEGHGTHVGGIIGGETYGVAKKVNLIAVQVLNEEGNGAISSLLAGLQWVSNDAKKHKGKAIINMSLGLRTGGGSSSTYKAFNEVLSSVVNSGIPLFAAAGNWASDTCDVLPAGNKDVFAVAATDKADTMAWYSGYGKCVDIFAPGSDVLSTYITSSTSTTTLSGTSMAAPHVAGVAALLMEGMENPTSADVYNKIKSIATSDVVKDAIKNTPNTFLFNGQQLTEKI